jgi:hypothetical protein
MTNPTPRNINLKDILPLEVNDTDSCYGRASVIDYCGEIFCQVLGLDSVNLANEMTRRVNNFEPLLEAAEELIEKVVSMTQSIFVMETEDNVRALVERDCVVIKARAAIEKARGK